MGNRQLIVIYKEDDIYELPIKYVKTIEEASDFIGCTVQSFYKNMHLCGVMKSNGYILELIQFNHKDWQELKEA